MSTLLSKSAILGALLLFLSCTNDGPHSSEPLDQNTRVLTEVAALGEFPLPVGSTVVDTGSSLEIMLPGTLSFLMQDASGKVFQSPRAEYTCTCSGTNSCKTFYAEGEYGCLHSSCTGSCTGTPSDAEKVVKWLGIVDMAKDVVVSSMPGSDAYLTAEGRQLFFEQFASKPLNDFAEFVYKPSGYKSTQDILNSVGPVGITKVELSLYGINFVMDVPFFENDESQLITVKSGPSVSCSGTDACTCEKKSKGAFGYRIYWCEGCSSCTISVIE